MHKKLIEYLMLCEDTLRIEIPSDDRDDRHRKEMCTFIKEIISMLEDNNSEESEAQKQTESLWRHHDCLDSIRYALSGTSVFTEAPMEITDITLEKLRDAIRDIEESTDDESDESDDDDADQDSPCPADCNYRCNNSIVSKVDDLRTRVEKLEEDEDEEAQEPKDGAEEDNEAQQEKRIYCIECGLRLDNRRAIIIVSYNEAFCSPECSRKWRRLHRGRN